VVLIIVGVSATIGYNLYNEIYKDIPKENHCLEKELTYYRTVGGLLTSTTETTKENADYSKMKCIKWEHELSFGSTLFGQRLIE